MKTTITLLVLTANLSVFSQGIQFIEARNDSDIAIINKRADEEKKLVFIDCFAEWCGPCKWMEKQVFTNDTVATFFNEHFICARMDMEKGIGISRTFKYQVYAYPTLIFIDKGIVHRATGARDVKGMIELGETALNPEKRFSFYQDKYNTGERNSGFIREYLKQLRKAGMETKEVADWYFATVNSTELLTKEHYEMIDFFLDCYYANAPENKVCDFLIQNKEQYIAIVGKEKVENKIFNTFQQSPVFNYVPDSANPGDVIAKFDEDAYNKIITKVKSIEFKRKEELILTFYLTYCQAKKDWKNYEVSAIKYVNAYLMNDFNSLNYYAWTFYENENIKSKEAINAAIGWAKRSAELSNDWAPADTYAAILYKSGNKKEALKAAESAIALGKKQGQDTTPTEEILEKIKAMK